MKQFDNLVIFSIATLLLILTSLNLHAELLFEDNFDSQADWATVGPNDVGILPDGWTFARTDENWHPNSTPNSQPSMLISGKDVNKVFGGSGKSFITYTESLNDLSNNGFTSDGFITIDFPPKDEVYVEFYVKFQPGFSSDSEEGQIKLFRALSFDGGERSKFFTSGDNAPIYIYDWSQNTFGLRHFHAFRCDDQAVNYFCAKPAILNPPRAIVSGDMSANFTTNVSSIIPQPQFIDQTNVEDILLLSGGVITHNQLFGEAWHKLAFHLKLNTALSVQDGVLKFWLDDQLVVDMDQIAWIGENGSMGAKWNSVSFGGNDRFHFNLDPGAAISDRERWYAIDNIKIYDGFPQSPMAPTNLFIE
jgi:hypothetical protein